MRDLAERALDTAVARGATHVEVRVVTMTTEVLGTKNGKVSTLRRSEDRGLGIRVIAGGAWGFASTDDLSRARIEEAAAEAVRIARASALFKKGDVILAPETPRQDEWISPVVRDPFAVSLDDKVSLLLKVDEALRGVRGVTVAETGMTFVREESLFLSSEGSAIRQVKTRSAAGYTASAFAEGDLQKRSYPNSFGGQWALKGYELIDELRLLENAPRIAEEAVALLTAPQCPSGVMDIILESSQLALQVHESCGHPIELDRVLGSEANYAGTSFLTPDLLGHFRYGSPAVTIVADATPAHGQRLGSFAYDDEGVPAQRTEIVREGQFVGYLSSRETAPAVGASRSSGAMRAEGWNRIPLIRMTNVSLLPGNWTLEALIEDTREGILLATNRSWSIDDRRLNFQFGTEIAWEIAGGRRGRIFKNPSYGGTTPEFWKACDAICDRDHWILWGIPNCGKGQPVQTMGVGHGAAPARFRKVRVGVAYDQ